MAEPILMALVGAESTGKTTLAAALVPRIARASGWRVAWVPELLRQWCEDRGRTPLQQEQQAILLAQHARIDAAAQHHDVVVCDTTALMTAVYSRIVFGDRSLDTQAAQLHRRVDLTLLTALDIPWVADGLQREGPQVQEPVDSALRELLNANGLPYSVVHGSGEARLQHAMTAVMPLLPRRLDGSAGDARGAGLQPPDDEGAVALNPARMQRYCDCCSVPELERALFRR